MAIGFCFTCGKELDTENSLQFQEKVFCCPECKNRFMGF